MTGNQGHYKVNKVQSRVYLTNLKNIASSSPTTSKLANPSSGASSRRNVLTHLWRRRSSVFIDDTLSDSDRLQKGITASLKGSLKSKKSMGTLQDNVDPEVYCCKKKEGLSVIQKMKKTSIMHIQQGNNHEALKNLNQTLSFQEKLLGENHPDVATTLNLMGVVMGGMGDDYRYMAMTSLEESLRIRQEHFGPGSKETARSAKSLWVLLHKSNGLSGHS